ncbi:MAG TPA: hypothetical protein PK670_17125, partial [Acidovorax defluvii]|nr:hypothetical protein [Acidovorax defluvii]HQS65411.1 hypothetical protein [Acidovorax defluvii]
QQQLDLAIGQNRVVVAVTHTTPNLIDGYKFHGYAPVMEKFFHLFMQALIQAIVFCALIYLGMDRSSLTTTGKKWLYAKLVAVFIVFQVILQMVLPMTGDPAKDYIQNLIGPLLLTYLAGRFAFSRSNP